MAIRNAAKAVIIKNGKILLNKCLSDSIGEYYTLPGGGQNQYETLHEAVIRECLEETGYLVKPLRFAALYEEICTVAELREKYPDYCHKIYHVFICELSDELQNLPTEIDGNQIASEWIEVDFLYNIPLFPKIIGDNIIGIINNPSPVFLGSAYNDF